MPRTTKTEEPPVTFEVKQLRRHLYEQSAVFTGAAHAMIAAADQLRAAHSNDFCRAAVEVRSAAMVAMHAALSAHQLVGAYELAGWLKGIGRATTEKEG